jgi:nucleotide-binding universal stress UspA family protein
MYKTIVVHVDGSAQQDSRMAAAARLAREHDAHLVASAATGISWTDYLILTGSMVAPIPPADFDGLRRTASLHLRAFADHAARLGIASVETRLVEDTADGALLLQARYADLVVLSRDVDPEPGIAPRVRRLPEHVALRGVRPVLVVPPDYADRPVASTVVAGWDGSTQALRALAAALPLLQRADGVRLVVVNPDRVNPDRLSDLHGEQPGADMALYLARHGVKVDVVLERTHATVGSTLMAQARAAGAGLIVAGAYGHSRYREWVLGGVTRELLERTPVPLLLAH